VISDRFDFHASLWTTRSPRHVAKLFASPTWQVRKSSWTDYEIESPFAELEIMAWSPILLNGFVADAGPSVDRILVTLQSAGIAYDGECYESDGTLLREFRWNVEGGRVEVAD